MTPDFWYWYQNNIDQPFLQILFFILQKKEQYSSVEHESLLLALLRLTRFFIALQAFTAFIKKIEFAQLLWSMKSIQVENNSYIKLQQ